MIKRNKSQTILRKQVPTSCIIDLCIDSYIDRNQRLTSGLFESHQDMVGEYLLVLWLLLLFFFCSWGWFWLFALLSFFPTICERNPKDLLINCGPLCSYLEDFNFI